MTRPFLLLALIGCAMEPPVEQTASSNLDIPRPTLQPLYRVRLHGIATSDTNGGNASPVTAARVESLMADVNAILASARIHVDFDPETDFETRASTLLNRRFGVQGLLAGYTDPDVRPPTTTTEYDAARRAAADEHRDKITVIFAAPLDLEYSTAAGHWVLVPDSTGGSSGRFGRWVSWKHQVSAGGLAHELGHYLHNRHTFVSGIEGVADAAERIADYIADGNPVANGLDALDGDRNYVLDTPADAAGSIYIEQFGTKCDPDLHEIDIPVTYGNNQHATFTLAPDRDLAMSYFGCGDPARFSGDQTQRIHDALTLGNRRGVMRYMSLPLIDTTPTLELLDEETAGTISQVKLARIGVNRVVTASVSSGSLKLIVWDVGTSGAITRRGDIVVGDIGSDFEITHGGLDQVIVAYRGTGSGLGLKSYRVSSAGTPSLLDTESAGDITDLALARIDPTTFVTPVRLTTGVMRVIAWSIDAHGTITRRAHHDSSNIDSVEAVTAYHPISGAGEDVEAAATVFARHSLGLSVQTWKVESDPWAVTLAQLDNAGTTLAAAASELDFDLAATVVRTSSNLQKVIAWKIGYDGSITRGGSATPTLECDRVASAAMGTRWLVTACRRSDLKTQLRLFEVGPNGATVTERFGQYWGTADELALAEVGSHRVVLATASTSGALKLRTFGMAP